MAQKEKDLNPILLAEVLSDEKASPTRDKLIEILYKRLLKEEVDEDEAKRLRDAARKAGMEAMIKGREMELAKQDQCPHQDPYGGSVLAGQRLHSHNIQYICQFCSKEFKNNEVPLHLRITSDKVGGPDF